MRDGFLAHYLIVHVQQRTIGRSHQVEVDRSFVSRQGVEGIDLVLRHEFQDGSRIAIMVSFGTDDDVAVTRAGSRFLQACCAILPSTVIRLDLRSRRRTQGDTNGIDDVDILALILHVLRTTETGGDKSAEIVLQCAHLRLVLLIHRSERLHTRVADILKGLRKTVRVRDTQVGRRRHGLGIIGVEIHDLVTHRHLQHELFTDQFGPYLPIRGRTRMQTKLDGIIPDRLIVQRIRQDDIMLIYHADTGDHEIGSFRKRGIKLIQCFIIDDIRAFRIIATWLSCNR